MTWRVACLLVVLGIAGGLMLARTTMASSGGPVPAPAADDALASKPATAKAVFAGGCFWGTQAVFERLKGVVGTTVGYRRIGRNETYDQVTTETRATPNRWRWCTSLADYLRDVAAHLLFRGA